MQKAYTIMMLMPIRSLGKRNSLKGAVPKVMTATLNVVVSINSTTVMQTYWTAPFSFLQSVFCTFQCIKHKTHISEASSAERLKWLDEMESFVQKLTKFLQSVFCTF